ncbi:MAG: hypothetical protein ABIH18_05670 [Candidatus Omnitrophota bacterium]
MNGGGRKITKKSIKSEINYKFGNWLLDIGYWNLFVSCFLVIGD